MRLLKALLLALTMLCVPAWAADVKLADLNFSFALTADTDVRVCTLDQVACGAVRHLAAAGGINCGIGFEIPPGTAAKGCFSVVAAPTLTDVCWPTGLPLALSYHFEDAPTGYTSVYSRAIVFIDCSSTKWTVQTYSDAERASFEAVLPGIIRAAAFNGPSVVSGINAWRRTQPVHEWTAEEGAWIGVLLAKYAPPAASYVVQPVSSTVVGDRPVYRLKADGTRNTTAVSGKRAIGNTPCGTKALGNYRDIPSLKDITGDVYALCSLKP